MVYKRITVAVLEAAEEGDDYFKDGERMKRFDVAFANRVASTPSTGIFIPTPMKGQLTHGG